MVESQETVTIGDLLHKAGLLSQDQLARAMAMSIRTAAPLGAVLAKGAVVPAETLRTASLAHSQGPKGLTLVVLVDM